jgi:hypothetical protein
MVEVAVVGQPAYLNYQGRLNDAAGQPLATATYTLEFNIYNDPVGTNPTNRVWGPFILDGGAAAGHGAAVDVINGRFNVILGPADTTGRSIRDAFEAENRYLEIKVNNGAPILPRQQFLSSPYAFKARGVTGNLGVPGDLAVQGNLSLGGAVQGNVNVQGTVSSTGEITSTVSGVTYFMVPRGAIIMWSGAVATIPAGWVLCDGSNGTPDLRDRFVRGASAANVGTTGGATNHTHTFSGTTGPAPGTGSIVGGIYLASADWFAENHTHSFSGTTAMTTGQNHLPPYYRLAFIMKQ